MNISIISPGGVTNLGERAILIGTLEYLAKKYPKSNITIFGYNDAKNFDKEISDYFEKNNIQAAEPLFDNKESKIKKLQKLFNFYFFPKKSLNNGYKELLSADLVVSKGQETLTSKYGLVHYIDSILEAFLISRVNDNVVLLGHSIGPISNSLQKFIAKFTLKKVKKVYARDDISMEKLSQINYENRERSKDMAYYCLDLYKGKRKKSKKLIIFPNKAVISDSQESDYVENISTIITHFNKLKYEVIITNSVIAEDWNNDKKLVDLILEKNKFAKYEKISSLKEFVRLIYSSQVILSTRLHPTILASGLDVEIIALSNAQKVYGILKDAAVNNVILDPINIDKNEFEDLFKRYNK